MPNAFFNSVLALPCIHTSLLYNLYEVFEIFIQYSRVCVYFFFALCISRYFGVVVRRFVFPSSPCRSLGRRNEIGLQDVHTNENDEENIYMEEDKKKQHDDDQKLWDQS